MEIEITKLDEKATIPSYAHEGDAGLDLHSIEEYELQPGERKLFKTGIAMAIPQGYYGSIRGRSGLAYKKGISILGGVIDSHYRGDIGVIMYNTGKETLEIREGDRIAQLLIEPIQKATLKEVRKLEETIRAEKGFGSTGQ